MSEQVVNDGGPAFPHAPVHIGGEEGWATQFGMSLRDYFAGQAMLGILAAHAGPDCSLPGSVRTALQAYEYADAMLKVR